MNQNKFTISIPSPCHENWDEMTPVEQGRFCNACQKKVTDFTVMTDAEIIKTLQTSAGNTCGRFFSTQLERPIQPITQPSLMKAFINKAAGLFLLLQIAGETAKAQEQKKDTTATEVVDSGHKAERQDTVSMPASEKKKSVRKKQYEISWDTVKETEAILLGFTTTTLNYDPHMQLVQMLTADAPKVSLMKRLTNYWMGKR